MWPAPLMAESHHIVPKSVGGTDDAENIIRLSPPDHFFAHLLLARIYGGRLWVPVVLWCGGDKKNWRARKSRLNYAWVAKAARRHVGGKAAWQYDHTIHKLEHRDGMRVQATQYEMLDLVGGVRSGINLLLRGKVQSYRGWFLAGRRPDHIGRGGRPGNLHHMADRKRRRWIHLDGAEFVGTRVDFCEMSGVSKKAACLIVNGQQAISKGWSLYGTKIPKLGGATHRQNRPQTGDASRAEYRLV